MRRQAPGLALLSALVVGGFMATPASAGGGNFIEFEPDHFAPGMKVVAKNRYFTRSDVGHGPYYGYLLKEVRNWNPSMEDYREGIVLGRVEILWPQPGWEGSMKNNPKLTFSFDVPEIPSGDYLVSLCNSPCTHPLDTDINPTGVQILKSPLEARLLERMDDLMRSSYRYQSSQSQARAREDRKLSRRIQAVRTDATHDAERLEQKLASALRGAEDKPGWSGVIALVVGGMAMSAITTLLLSRRKRKEVGSPDPFDRLLEESERELAGRV